MIEVITLGTGSAVPGLLRNHSSVAIVRDGELYLFDCGEGTQIQFQKIRLRTSNLKNIFISHMHGDHIFGLLGFLTTLSLNGREAPLTIYGPSGIGEYVKSNLKFSYGNLIYPVNFIEISAGDSYELNEEISVDVFSLSHRVPTFGFRIREADKPGKFNVDAAKRLGVEPGPLYGKLQKGLSVVVNGRTIFPDQVLGEKRKGKSIVYAVDTEPCEDVIEYSKGVDMLIYDGTYKDEDIELARRGKHSTHGEGIEIAVKNNVKKLVLTHFSQRYMEMFHNKKVENTEVIFAYDLMRITV